MITDCHIHIQPIEMFKPQALELMKKQRANFDQIAEFCRSPQAFLQYLDAAGVERAVLINYVAPEVIGFTSGVNRPGRKCSLTLPPPLGWYSLNFGCGFCPRIYELRNS